MSTTAPNVQAGYPGYDPTQQYPQQQPPQGYDPNFDPNLNPNLGGQIPGAQEGEQPTQQAVSVVVTAIAENRSDGSWWVVGTVGGAAYNFRWSKPLDPVVPGAVNLAQQMANEYQAVQNYLTAVFLGKTITVTLLGTPTPQVYSVVFAGTLPANWNASPGRMALQATVNGAGPYTVLTTVNEFLGLANAGQNIGQIVAGRIVANYMACVGGPLAPYINTFAGITPQSVPDEDLKKLEAQNAPLPEKTDQQHPDLPPGEQQLTHDPYRQLPQHQQYPQQGYQPQEGQNA
jgi:hypothetical protein